MARTGKRVNRPTALVFGDVKLGNIMSRVVFLTNESDVPVSWQFVVEDKGTFQFDRTYGVIPPKLEAHVIVRFEPEVSGNFYRRIFCLVKNQLPLAIDCVATAYADLSRRPAPLSLMQVDAHRRRQLAGLGNLSPAELAQLIPQRPELFDLSHVHDSPCGGSTTRLSRSGEATERELGVVHQFFEPQCGVGREVTLREDRLDFGGCTLSRPPDKKVAHVTNHTNAKITVMWRIPLSDDEDDELDFAVLPASADIAPGETFAFKVVFRPSQNDFYYNQELEAYAFFKSNRNFRLVNNDTLTPPWCLTTRVFGHTFGSASEQFIAKIETNLRRGNNVVSFPSCHVGDSVFQTVQMTNRGDTPTTFAFESDPSRVFTIKPDNGVIEAGGFTLVAIRFTPNSVGQHRHTTTCLLNNSAMGAIKFQFSGLGSSPAIVMGTTDGTLFFKPTSTGIVSHRALKLHNVGRVPAIFRWEIPPAMKGIFSVTPVAGRLKGNETIMTEWVFAPNREDLYDIKVPLVIRSLGGAESAKKARTMTLKISGTGSTGAVSFHPSSMDMGTTLVGDECTKTLTLANTSDCDLHFRVDSVMASDLALIDEDGSGTIDAEELRAYARARNAMADAAGEDGNEDDPGAGDGQTSKEELAAHEQRALLGFEPSIGYLPARSRTNLKLTYRPTAPATNEFRIFCDIVIAANDTSGVWDKTAQVKSVDPSVFDDVKSDPLWCDVIGKAAYPTLKIVDARSPQISPAMLWHQHELRALNYELSTPLSRTQVHLNNATGVGDDVEAYNALFKEFNFQFTPRPAGSRPEVVSYRLQNVSNLMLDFSFRFPNELDVEMEQWADKGEPSEVELRQNSIIDQRLFQVEPKSASLKPGESVVLRISYSYECLDYAGDHSLPLLLKLEKGKQVRVWLRGRTLPPAQARLFTPSSSQIILQPTPIGHTAPPLQSVLIVNPSNIDVQYRIDLAPLAKLRAENYDFPIISCPDAADGVQVVQGFLPAGASTSLPLVFKPLEAKAYELDLDVHYRGADGELCATGSADGLLNDQPAAAEMAIMRLELYARGYLPDERGEDVERSSGKDNDDVIDEEFEGLSAEERLELAARRAHERSSKLLTDEEVRALEMTGAEAPEFGAPAQQTLMWSGMLAHLSVDRIDFGVLPSGSTVSRISIIRNKSLTTNTFAWDENHPLFATGSLKVYPRQGAIAPGDVAVCKFVFTAGMEPEVFDTDVRCRFSVPQQKVAEKAGRRRGRRNSTASRRALSSIGSQAGRSSTAGSQQSRVSVVNRTTMASRGGLREMSSQGRGTASMRSLRVTTAESHISRGGKSAVEDVFTTQQASSMLLFAHITATVCDHSYYRSIRAERTDPGKLIQSEHAGAPPTTTEAAPREAKLPENIQSLTMQVMSQLIEDVVGDPAVAHLCQDLPPPSTPFFKQLPLPIEDASAKRVFARRSQCSMPSSKTKVRAPAHHRSLRMIRRQASSSSKSWKTQCSISCRKYRMTRWTSNARHGGSS